MEQLKYRYPGIIPFTKDEKQLFFGRKKDIDKICRFLSLENLMVLHSKSGIGKTSLINAGIIPKLSKESASLVIKEVRLHNYNAEIPQDPCEIAEEILDAGDSFLDRIPLKNASLWFSFKEILLINQWAADKEILLILDQFEELFTYPDEYIHAFSEQLGYLYHREMPAEISKAIRRGEIIDESLSNDIEELKLERWLTQPLNIKILISIRSDRLHLINRLKVDLPEIMINTYELDALSIEQAKDAIILPATQSGDFASPKFEYSSNALTKILAFLTNRNRSEKIESFELQVVCKFIEQNVIKRDVTRVEAFNLGGDLGEIIRKYYENQLESLSDEERKNARIFIEDRLIIEDEEGDRRISLDEAVARTIVSQPLLEKLVNSHLIRRQINIIGKYSYEISHDTLIEPIKTAKIERIEHEKQAKDKKQAEDKRKERSRKNRILIAIIIIIIAWGSGTGAIIVENNRTKSELSKTNGELKQQTDLLDTVNVDLKLKRDSLRKISDTLQQKLEDRNRIIDSIQGRGELQAINVRDLANALADKNTTINNLNKKNQEQSDKLQALQNQVDSLRRSTFINRPAPPTNALEDLTIKNKYIQDLTDELAEADATISKQKEMLRTLSYMNPKEAKKLRESESELTRRLRIQEAKADRRVKELEIELTKLKEELKRLKNNP